MIRRSQSRYQKDLRQLLLIEDSQLLEDYDREIRERTEQCKRHQKMLALRKKKRKYLMLQTLVGITNLSIGLIVIAVLWFILTEMYR